MIPLSPTLLIATANAFVGLGVGRFGDALPALFRRECAPGAEDPGRAWDAAFVQHVGHWSHFDERSGTSSWPLPVTGDVAVLATFARGRSVLREDPRVGDIFLLASSLGGGFQRVGIILSAGDPGTATDGTRYRECVTIEGDSARDFSAAGGLVLRHRRKLSAARGDRFLRWSALDVRHVAAGDVGSAAEAMGLARPRASA